MATTKKVFEDILEVQQKMIDWWEGTSSKMMNAMMESTTEDFSEITLMKEWSKQQQTLFEEMIEIGSDQKNWAKAPQLYGKYLEMQMEYLDKWNKNYQSKMEDFKMPYPNGFTGDNFWSKSWEEWNSKMGKSNFGINNEILEKLPDSMKAHYKNFTEIYEELFQHWESFQRMIQFGMHDPKVVQSFFSVDSYQKMIDKIMGFSSTGNIEKMIARVNEFFEQYLKFVVAIQPDFSNWENSWKAFSKKYFQKNHEHFFQTMFELNQQIHDHTNPFVNKMSFGKSGRFTKMIKDLQFSYTAFLIRNAEMQSLVYQTGQFALPQTIKSFYEEYKTTEELPNFNEFINQLVENLEKHINDLLHTKDYAVLQAEVVKLGTVTKMKMDELTELGFEQTPFMMRSQGDDLAKEIQTLRKKIRTLEKKIKDNNVKGITKKMTSRRSKTKRAN